MAHFLAGKPAPQALLIDVSKLERAYYKNKPDPTDPRQQVSFGTSGHRGTPDDNTFTESHILAITQALVEYRQSQKINGPLFLGKDTHALSGVAQRTAVEVLAANDVVVAIEENDGYTPTPVISWHILTYNRGRKTYLSDGIVITPSHNPPQDGGFKYNSINGGPADTDITGWVQKRANEILLNGNRDVIRIPYEAALKKPNTHRKGFGPAYVSDLGAVIDIDAIRNAKLRIGADPLGGASVKYWDMISSAFNLNITVVNKNVDPTFAFMPVDHDGKIRMDCSSPYAMANLVKLAKDYDIAFGNDPDSDRHGIVTPSAGLMNPNHYLAVAIGYLLTHRPHWPTTAAVGKTLVSSSMIDRVVGKLGRTLNEVPVGFKWFVDGLFTGNFCFGGEESAGASFLRDDGSAWTTDKDGILLNLLAAEITAVTGRDPGEHYEQLTNEFGSPLYTRIDAPASPEQKAAFKNLTQEKVTETTLAGDLITARLTRAPGNDAPIGGLKVTTDSGWFAARPSGTENIYKIYAESFKDQSHLDGIVAEAKEIVSGALK